MVNTLEVTRTLTDTGLKPDQAAAITHAVQQAAEHGKHVTPEEFKAGIAELRAEIADHRAAQRGETAELRSEISSLRAEISRSESRIIKWVVGIVLTATGIVTAAGVAVGLAILRPLGALAGG